MTTSAGQTSASEALAPVELAGSSEKPLVTPAAEPAPETVLAAATDPAPEGQPLRPHDQGSHPGAKGRTRETLHRASTAARGAIGDNVKRVEKIHHVSTAMFEEAHSDPSLRFVLVALGLFVVFIVLLILSKVMG